jgi:thiol-disulfide isomerase/thioredoxin
MPRYIILMLLFISTMHLNGCKDDPLPSIIELKIGKAAPNFELENISGETVSLENLSGKIVLLDFWATWCPPCVVVMPILESLQKEFPENLVVLGINFQESKEAISAFLESRDLSVESLMDPEALVAETYQVDAIPTQILIDQNGQLVARHVGLLPPVGEFFRPMIKTLLDEPRRLSPPLSEVF